MKKVLFSLALLSLMAFTLVRKENLPPDEEKYKVIKVNGQILIRKSGKSLSQGDELLASTPLQFKTTDSRAAVISPTKGRFVLTAPGSDGKTNMIPGMNNVASRSGALLNIIDLQNHFSGDYVFLEKVKLKISREAYPMDDQHFFYAEMDYMGEKIPKKLEFSGDTLCFERSKLFMIDGKPVDVLPSTEITLKYRKSPSNENIRISTFSGIFPDLEELKLELSIILNNTENKKASEQLDEVQAYIHEFYGKTDKDNLQEWVLKNFMMK